MRTRIYDGIVLLSFIFKSKHRSSALQSLIVLKKRIAKAIEDDSSLTLLEILLELDSLSLSFVDLKRSKVGKSVQELRNHKDEKVCLCVNVRFNVDMFTVYVNCVFMRV